MDSSKLIDKLKKLFAMADPENGATDNEMQAAMAAAQRLMTEHGINEADVLARKVDASDILHETMDLERREWYSDGPIFHIILRMLSVRILKAPYCFRRDNGYMEKYLKVIFIGQEAQVAVAMLFYAKLRAAFLTGTRRYMAKTKQRWSAQIQRGYDRGLETGFVKANHEAKAAAEQAAGQSYALMVRDTREAIDNYVDRHFSLGKNKPAKAKPLDAGAFAQGQLDGSTLSLHEKLRPTETPNRFLS